MRLDRHFGEVVHPMVILNEGTLMPFRSYAFCGFGIIAPPGQWAEVYRIAYERTIEALRPTRYDWALRANEN